MTLEERIVEELHAERRLVPAVTPGAMPKRAARWPRYVSMAAALALMVGAGVWLYSVRSPSPEALIADARAEGEITIDGEVVLPVVGEPAEMEVRGEGLPLLFGAPAPRLDFDLDVGGVEQPLVVARPKWDQSTWAGNVPLVYIGDRSGRSIFVHTNGTIGFLDRLLAGGNLGAHICMTIGDTTTTAGGAGFCSSAATATGGTLHDNTRGVPVGSWWATWIDVPDGTALVTLSIGGEAAAWQRPAGQTAFFDLAMPPAGEIVMTAVGTGGEELATTSVPAETFSR